MRRWAARTGWALAVAFILAGGILLMAIGRAGAP